MQRKYLTPIPKPPLPIPVNITGVGVGAAAEFSDAYNPDKVAWVTLITADQYALGAIVLLQSLIESNSVIRNKICIVTSDVTTEARGLLEYAGYKTVEAPSLSAERGGERRYLNTFTKLYVWSMTGFDRLVFLDADTLLLRNMDEIFASFLPDEFSVAAGDDCCDKWNSGVLVLQPSSVVYSDMLQNMHTMPSFDGGDGGFLNSYFPGSKRKRLPFTFNADQIILSIPRYHTMWSIDALRLIHYAGLKPWDTIDIFKSENNDETEKEKQQNNDQEERRKEVAGLDTKLLEPLHAHWHRAYERMLTRLPSALRQYRTVFEKAKK